MGERWWSGHGTSATSCWRNCRGAEIGVWKGDFSAKILTVAKPAVLHLIDPWQFEPGPDYQEALYGGRLESGQSDMDAVYEAVTHRFAAECLAGTVTIHRAPSIAVAPTFPDRSFDWVYIDGNHRYEFVQADLEAWWPKVKAGGIVAGDDYRNGGWWEGGVKRAVDKFVARHGYNLVLTGRQFLITVG